MELGTHLADCNVLGDLHSLNRERDVLWVHQFLDLLDILRAPVAIALELGDANELADLADSL
jgi:hypothetical protein